MGAQPLALPNDIAPVGPFLSEYMNVSYVANYTLFKLEHRVFCFLPLICALCTLSTSIRQSTSVSLKNIKDK